MTSSACDLLERVQAELRRRHGELREIAEAANMHYDTVRRIRSGANDPGYSKVRRLAEFLQLIPAVPTADGESAPLAVGTPPAELEGERRAA